MVWGYGLGVLYVLVVEEFWPGLILETKGVVKQAWWFYSFPSRLRALLLPVHLTGN